MNIFYWVSALSIISYAIIKLNSQNTILVDYFTLMTLYKIHLYKNGIKSHLTPAVASFIHFAFCATAAKLECFIIFPIVKHWLLYNRPAHAKLNVNLNNINMPI